MKVSTIGYWTAFGTGMLLSAALGAAETNKSQASTNKIEISIFPDKNLEAAVRKFVFEKRDNNKPITEADVVSLSTINGSGMQIKNLAGLDKCKSLASLDLSKNQISKLDPLKDLKNIQYLNLANNQIEDVSPLSGISALQYIELSNNKVKDIKPLASLTNMASLYLGNNQVPDISPAELLNEALKQLIYDTPDDSTAPGGVYSALRGHSLARNMYGYNPATLNYTPFNGADRKTALSYQTPAFPGFPDNHAMTSYQRFDAPQAAAPWRGAHLSWWSTTTVATR